MNADQHHHPAVGGEEFAALVDAVEDYAIFMLSPTGEILTWNVGASRVMGYTEQEAAGRHFSMFYTPEDLEAEKPRHELETAGSGGRIEDEGWRVRKDGKRFWANTVITALRHRDGSIRGFAKVTRDMTARRQAEEDLRQSMEIFQLLVSSVRDYAIFMLDPNGNVATWNVGASRIKGYTAEEIMGKHVSTFYTEADKHNGKAERELRMARELGSVEDEGWRVRKDGTRFWANVVITAVYDATGRLRGFAKVTRDITDKKKAEEAIRESNEVFQLLVSSVRDYAIFMLDTKGDVATWNSGAERIKGYTASEIIGKHVSTFYTEDDKHNGKAERELRTAREQGSVEDEGWRVRKDGSRFWANVVISAVYDEHRELRGFAKVTRDITEKKEAEETQRALLEQREARLMAEEERRRAEASYHAAQEANRAKDEFLMTLSHELRTPMTAILGWARLLPSISPSDPLFREAVQSISGGAQLQARLIDDVLDVSRIVSGKMRLAPETIEIARVIHDAIEAVTSTAAAKQIEITTSLPASLGTMIVDPTRLQQVIWNLVSNAVKFTPRGGAVTVSARRTASQVQISVSDNGEGIDPRFLPHVFEPFRQAETPQTRVHGGLGLGLSIVRYIAEAHGGTAAAASEGRGKGATFTVTLPIRVTTTPSTAVQNTMGDTFLHRDRLRGVEIVSVDDDRDARKMVEAVLRAAGANVVSVDSAAAALEAVDHHQPDVVLTDVAMPDVDGYTLTRTLRQRTYGKELKIIALTAFPPSPEERGGFDLYLTKPIDPFRLVEEVARVALAART
ncbi:MAG: PAS domain S-box protein [Acidobacteriota bacterium]|nr:PAS domain S-box protein [Acidobacteriota bacterium]